MSITTVTLPAHTITVQVSIRVTDLPIYAVVPDYDDKGKTQAQPDVVLRIPYGITETSIITARLKGRSFRRIVREIRQLSNPPEKLVLVGRLNSVGELEGAGFLPSASKDGIRHEPELVS